MLFSVVRVTGYCSRAVFLPLQDLRQVIYHWLLYTLQLSYVSSCWPGHLWNQNLLTKNKPDKNSFHTVYYSFCSIFIKKKNKMESLFLLYVALLHAPVRRTNKQNKETSCHISYLIKIVKPVQRSGTLAFS